MIRGQRVVVDASVALKWQLTDEEHVVQALALRDDFVQRGAISLVAPTLFLYEVANGLVVASRRGRLPTNEVINAIQYILDFGLELRPPDWQRTCRLALDYDLTAYDGSYLALAEAEGCYLWTGDRGLHEAVRDDLDWVRWIGDYRT